MRGLQGKSQEPLDVSLPRLTAWLTLPSCRCEYEAHGCNSWIAHWNPRCKLVKTSMLRHVDLETWLPIPCLDYKAMENQFNQKEECKCRIIVECLPICSHCCPSLLSRPVCRVALSTGGNAWVVPWDYRSGTHFSRGNNLCHLCNIQTVTIANPPRPSKILFLSSGWQR